MSTYVLSDCHGCYEQFIRMLDLIEFSNKDDLYILGDVIDRGKDGIAILQYIMKHDNIHFIVGNHEDMMYRSYCSTKLKKRNGYFVINGDVDLWFSNGGQCTAEAFLLLEEKEQLEIISYIENSLLAIPELIVNGQKFFLVHAFPIWKENYKYIDNFRTLDAYDMLWTRLYEYDDNTIQDIIPQDTILIFGHSKIDNLYYYIDNILIGDDEAKRKIYHYNKNNARFIDIDCGCSMANMYDFVKMGCLRLDDMKEFYC